MSDECDECGKHAMECYCKGLKSFDGPVGPMGFPIFDVEEKRNSMWISVKDRLPEKEGIYWVCYEINGRLKSHYCLWEEKSRKYLGNKFGWRSREQVRRENIRFWMPLPLPPKE